MPLKRPAASIDPDLVKPQLVVAAQAVLNPLKVSFDKISHDIIGIHDSQAKRQDVDSLYNIASNIVRNSTHVADFLDSKHPKTVDLVQDMVPQSTLMPPFSTLKEIACQMACNPFNASTAHETIIGILGKIKSYTWDAKAVIALAAFALDYGESLQLSLMQSTKQSSLELHVFRLGSVEKDKPTLPNAQLKLVDLTLQLIQKIIDLEKKIVENNIILKYVPILSAAKREVYTYWAIFALVCASQITQLEWDLKSEVLPKLNAVFLELDNILEQLIDPPILPLPPPAGILVLLKTLIFLWMDKPLPIFDNSTKTMVNPEVIKKQFLLLFISGLDNIEDDIWELKSIDEAFKKDKDKQDYRILWIPVVDKWSDELKKKFENLKSLMPWYVVEHFEPLGGIKMLQEELHYNGKPIVMVTNPRGEIINKNAKHMIFVWGIEAFPFQDVETLSEHWNWLWFAVKKVHPDIEKWINEDKYIFLYGGVDSFTQRLTSLLDAMKNDSIIEQADVAIENFNLGKVDTKIASKFWDDINNLFQSHVLNENLEKDPVIEDIEMLFSMKEEKGWVIVSKGQKVLAINCDPLMTNVFEDFKDWKKDVIEKQGFDKAFMGYYEYKRSVIPPECSHFKVVNISSKVAMNIPCPCCDRKMEVESVTYNCCHGKHDHHAANVQENSNININASPSKLKY